MEAGDTFGKIATKYGVAFTLVLFLLFTISERVGRRRVASEKKGLEQFNLDHQEEIVGTSLTARPGCVLSEVYDHTSVLKLVEEKWNLPALTRRDAAAMSPISALDFSAPPTFLDPPVLPAPNLPWGSW